MNKIYIAILLVFFTVTGMFSQSKLNNYKYVIVPNKFDFLKENNQYQLNALSEFLFNKYGFTALMEGSKYPEDLVRNRCLALKSNLLKDSGMFKTKLAVELKDCNDLVVFTSEMGESREKEYQRAYTEALRNAFKSVEALNYKYEPGTSVTTIVSQQSEETNEVSKEIQQLREEIQNLKKEKDVVASVKEQVAIVKSGLAKENAIEKNETTTVTKETSTNVLYAQAIDNGFQLVDSTPKVVYKIQKTSIPDVFLVENKNATLYKKDTHWILEYYENNVLKQEILNIKF